MKRKQRAIRVIGNSRSGTTWLGRVLREIGHDVGHEYVRDGGTVSCFFFIDTPVYPLNPSGHPKGKIAHVGERLSDYRFKHTVMIVRHPLKAIGSIWSTIGIEHQAWLERHRVIPKGLKPKLLKAMHVWYRVNLACERRAEALFRLEDLVRGKREWKRFLRALEVPVVPLPDIPPTNKSRGIFKARVVTWKDLAAQDPELTKEIRAMWRRYTREVRAAR